ncbi:unnamed protein product [Thlaspi arvense]|uniref:Uncharacterized protein n=1 Tax=Thlaspi arvense TaxID=13288 RepID=A0AAU9SAD3_THLAR|nr:unnamed protein product [Thlaspi arvense]
MSELSQTNSFIRKTFKADLLSSFKLYISASPISARKLVDQVTRGKKKLLTSVAAVDNHGTIEQVVHNRNEDGGLRIYGDGDRVDM